MRLPNKVTKYEESIFPVMLSILEVLQNGPQAVDSLYVSTRFSSKDVSNFIDALDALFFLRKIKITEGGQITYAGGNL
jgi:hypothetical protein